KCESGIRDSVSASRASSSPRVVIAAALGRSESRTAFHLVFTKAVSTYVRCTTVHRVSNDASGTPAASCWSARALPLFTGVVAHAAQVRSTPAKKFLTSSNYRDARSSRSTLRFHPTDFVSADSHSPHADCHRSWRWEE